MTSKITLATLPAATAQEVFDQVARHLMTQGEPAMNADGSSCVYHAADGLMCAAGCLIAPEEMRTDWEGRSWDSATRRGAPEAHVGLIERLQTVHDSARGIPTSEVLPRWRAGLSRVAHRCHLSAAA
ncbi:hypothetical protein [Coralloluteibacterium stylophorae]|uniref:Uncharacterized protein n=1 Tax=Coralloluteibacterium stylophorae TaxID=1776034 RepID=A0A8J7VZ03_9GAMM|nr:hypothetical protein [Coralloluteibacterium stylophorae]MBS7458845.1 hypothetical protein [Coralloluteibacterium stylophorae]